jgi:hypothetical protein
MRPIVLDLYGDPRWLAVARQQGAQYLLLSKTDCSLETPKDTVVIVDGRNRYEEGLELMTRLAAGIAPTARACSSPSASRHASTIVHTVRAPRGSSSWGPAKAGMLRYWPTSPARCEIAEPMADARAVLEVSRALQNILQTELSVLVIPPGTVQIESIDLLPDPVPPPRITIFLFNIHEDSFLKNRDVMVITTGPGSVVTTPPPTVVDLDYMISAWMSTTQEEHLVLGDVLRVLYDHPQIDAAALGAAWQPDEAVQVTLTNPSIEDQARIWTTFGFKRFKLALYYKVRVVPIASLRPFPDRIVAERSANATLFAPPRPGDLPAGTV